MRAGRHDRQITIERKQVTLDPVYGTELIAWVPLVAEPGSPTVAVRFWAEVQDALPSKAESVTSGLAVARNQVRIRFRYRDDVDSSMRILLHGDGADEVLQIVGGPASVGGRKDTTEVVCERYSS
jgi:head-tail adaptor